MKTILIFLVCLLMVGCNPCQRLTRRCPTHDSTSYVEVVKLDTVTVYTKPDTMTLLVPISRPCPDLKVSESNPSSSLTITTEGNVLTARVICKEDSLKVVIKDLERRLSSQQTIVQEKRVEVPVKYIPKIYKWSLGILIILILLSGGYVYLRIKGLKLW